MSELVQVGGHGQGLAATTRSDRWWVEPFIYGLGFGLFVIYSTWSALQGENYWVGAGDDAGFGGYLSPFYSPVLFSDIAASGHAPAGHALFGLWPEWWPSWIPSSPAILILAFPLSFRLTCYYYRKFYYRSYFMSPPACAVGAVKHDYRGETRLFLFQNIHRYTMYFAVLFVGILSFDAFQSFWRDGNLGIGVGSIILLINPILIAGYTFGCHSFRHLIGGKLDCFTCDKGPTLRYSLWKRVTGLNMKHQQWAWVSLIWVAWADIYIRLVASGVITDYNTWN